MTGQQWFICISTFIVGMIAGGYMYAVGYAPVYTLGDVPGAEETDVFIMAEQTGGCQMAGVCTSWVLHDNRTYEFIPAHGVREQTPEPVHGRLSAAQFQGVRNTITNTDVSVLTRPSTVCRSASDGIDYDYRITTEDGVINLTSCGTQFYDSALYKALLPLWGVMETGDTAGVFNEEVDMRASLQSWFPRTWDQE